MAVAPILGLAEHADRLLRWYGSLHAIPSFAEIAVMDTSEPLVQHTQKGWHLPASHLRGVDEFAPQFDRYLRAGYAWINLSLYGLHSDATLVLGIELPPRGPTGVPVGYTSVNYSGPSLETQADPRWRLRLTVLEDAG